MNKKRAYSCSKFVWFLCKYYRSRNKFWTDLEAWKQYPVHIEVGSKNGRHIVAYLEAAKKELLATYESTDYEGYDADAFE